MAKRYLADMIGEDYKRWQPGQTVLAATTTGSGKTWFVLNRLLPYAKAQGKHIVYYCNRKFLNMQVQANAQKQIFGALGEDRDGLSPYLHIRTYQHTERKRDFPNVIETDDTGFRQTIPARSILYYVFDEAIYFVQDGYSLEISESNTIPNSSSATSGLSSRMMLSSTSSRESRFMLPYQMVLSSITAKCWQLA